MIVDHSFDQVVLLAIISYSINNQIVLSYAFVASKAKGNWE